MDTHETPHRYSGPHNRSREHYSGPQMGQPAWSGNGGHAPRPQQKSGEIHNFGGSTIDGGPSIPIPAMQQGGEYRRATGQPPRAGGQMNPGAWTTNQAPHRAFNDNMCVAIATTHVQLHKCFIWEGRGNMTRLILSV